MVEDLVSERGIRDSFQKVKDDMSGLKNAIELSRLEFQKYPEKKEFYDFIKALDARLKGIEASLVSVQSKLSSLSSGFEKSEEKRAEVQKELKLSRKLIDKVPYIESRVRGLDSEGKKFSREFEAVKSKAYDLKGRVSDSSKMAEDVGVVELKLDSLSKELSTLREKYASIKNSVDEVLESEVDLAEYVTKSELEKANSEFRDVPKRQAFSDAELMSLKEDVEQLKKSFEAGRAEDGVVGLYGRGSESKSKGESNGFMSYLSALVVITVLVLAGYYIYTQVQPVQLLNASNESSAFQPVISANGGNFSSVQILSISKAVAFFEGYRFYIALFGLLLVFMALLFYIFRSNHQGGDESMDSQADENKNYDDVDSGKGADKAKKRQKGK